MFGRLSFQNIIFTFCQNRHDRETAASACVAWARAALDVASGVVASEAVALADAEWVAVASAVFAWEGAEWAVSASVRAA